MQMAAQQWKGSRPQRFSGGRVHIQPQNQLSLALQPKLSSLANCGIRNFQIKPTQQAVFKPHSKIFPEAYHKSVREVDLRGKKSIELSEQKQRVRPQKKHILSSQTTDEIKSRGIKPFIRHNTESSKQFAVEQDMQRKTRIKDLQMQRNHVPVTSLGDKHYKYPEYSIGFYQKGGLVPGSTTRPCLGSRTAEHKIQKVFTKPNWNVRVKLDQIQQDRNIVNSVEQWQQTILKQANPNWHDPDTFFERMQANRNPVKETKKGSKK